MTAFTGSLLASLELLSKDHTKSVCSHYYQETFHGQMMCFSLQLASLLLVPVLDLTQQILEIDQTPTFWICYVSYLMIEKQVKQEYHDYIKWNIG